MYRTAESVSPKHPDKLCDQISDATLDAALGQDANSRVAIETVGGHGLLTITGEITTEAGLDYKKIARQFVDEELEIKVNVAEQSSEIAQGVDTGGAGDQGIMIGYATSETPTLLPLETHLARSLNKRIYELFPHDGKTQVTLKDSRIEAVVASFQHAPAQELQQIISSWISESNLQASEDVTVHTNPAGDWNIGGFDSDVGLTGRKLAVDNYGPHIPIGGGCFSGKDPSKVDRSAAYMARRIAVDYLRKRSAEEVICQLAYAIGVAEPVQATVSIDGEQELVTGYDLTPKGISDFLDLKKPQFLATAQWGHFGEGFTWDK